MRFSGQGAVLDLASATLTIGLDDLKGLVQPEWFYDLQQMSWQGGNYKFAANSTACLWRTVLGLGTQSCRIFLNEEFGISLQQYFLKPPFLILHPKPLIFPDGLPCSGLTFLLWPLFLTQLCGAPDAHAAAQRSWGRGSAAGLPRASRSGTLAAWSSAAEGFGGRAGERGARQRVIFSLRSQNLYSQ